MARSRDVGPARSLRRLTEAIASGPGTTKPAPPAPELATLTADLAQCAREQWASEESFDSLLGDRMAAAAERARGLARCCDGGALPSAIALFRSLDELVDEVLVLARFARDGRALEAVARVAVTDHLELREKLFGTGLGADLGAEAVLEGLRLASERIAAAGEAMLPIREQERQDPARAHWSGLTRAEAQTLAGEMLDGPLAPAVGWSQFGKLATICKLLSATGSWYEHPGESPIVMRDAFGLTADTIRQAAVVALKQIAAAFVYLATTGQLRTSGSETVP